MKEEYELFLDIICRICCLAMIYLISNHQKPILNSHQKNTYQ